MFFAVSLCVKLQRRQSGKDTKHTFIHIVNIHFRVFLRVSDVRMYTTQSNYIMYNVLTRKCVDTLHLLFDSIYSYIPLIHSTRLYLY